MTDDEELAALNAQLEGNNDDKELAELNAQMRAGNAQSRDDEELAALDRALAARDALKADGVRDVIVIKERGATSFEEWADERRREIAKRLIYGR